MDKAVHLQQLNIIYMDHLQVTDHLQKCYLQITIKLRGSIEIYLSPLGLQASTIKHDSYMVHATNLWTLALGGTKKQITSTPSKTDTIGTGSKCLS